MSVARHVVVLAVVLASHHAAVAAPGEVLAQQKISEMDGGFTGDLDGLDLFGSAVASLGDLDGDGLPDLAVGAQLDDDGSSGSGAVWVLFLRGDGTGRTHQRVSLTQGGFAGPLDPGDRFTGSIADLGDLDGDGVTELSAGSPGDRGGGAAWVLFMDGVPDVPDDEGDDDEQDDEQDAEGDDE